MILRFGECHTGLQISLRRRDMDLRWVHESKHHRADDDCHNSQSKERQLAPNSQQFDVPFMCPDNAHGVTKTLIRQEAKIICLAVWLEQKQGR